MTNKKLLITGANSGIGLSLVKYLAKRFEIIAIARTTEILDDIPNVKSYKLDLSDSMEVNMCLDKIIEEHGFIPYVINNAGIMMNSSIPNLQFKDVMESFNVNSIAPLLIMQKKLPIMKANNFGRIINITSGAPLNCSEEYGAYSASKAALNAFTVTASKEFHESNIKINLMSPGPCKTKMAPNGTMDPSVCHPTVDYLLSIDNEGPTGEFFWLGYKIPLFPELDGVHWLEGKADERYLKVL